jgi:acetyl-CoA carboxylase biotin carboxyl carrier protein
MTFDEIQELIKLVKKSDLTDFKLKNKDFQIRIRTNKFLGGQPQTLVAPAPVAAAPLAPPPAVAVVESPSAAPVAEAAPVSTGKKTLEIKSPIVGTFYRSPGPDKPVFAKVGDTVKAGDVVCIIEAMKLFNEIESEVSGTIVKVLVEDANPVEYDQVLFLVEA